MDLLTEGTEAAPLLATSRSENPLLKLDVYSSIHRVYELIDNVVDVPISEEAMRYPDIHFNLTRPLEDQIINTDDTPALVYVLLLCRLQFLRERDSVLASSSLNVTRANLCELLAGRALRRQATKADSGSAGLLAMSRALVGGLHAFQGASDEVLERIREKEGYVRSHLIDGVGKTNALELAILGKARNFIKGQAAQRVVTAIWDGRVTYSSSSYIDILPDRWKHQAISLYNLKQAPVLDHYRLRVPKYRSIIDFFAFVVLFISFLAVIIDRQNRHEALPVSALSIHEKWFFLYALGFSLDKLASVAEHGFSIYAAGLTNGLDLMGIPIYAIAFGFRIRSIVTEEAWASDQAYAVLSSAACLMFPRLAFAAISNNLLILSLRAMLADFAWLLGIAVFCFLGFVFALNHLCDGAYSVGRIAEWLIFIWFGLDGSGIDASPEFHPILGPIIIVVYAALSNTLLVSLLVAILSGTYSSIASDAAAEDMFRKAVMTFEGVKADSLFDYVPPLNLVALLVMWPISQVTSPRWFHKINVATTRVLSLPILLAIAFYERQSLPGSPLRQWMDNLRVNLTRAVPVRWSEKFAVLEGAHWECSAVFEYPPDPDDLSEDNSSLPGDEEDAVEYHPPPGDRPRNSSRTSSGLGRPLMGSRGPSTSGEGLLGLDRENKPSDATLGTATEPTLIPPPSPSAVATSSRPEVRFSESPPASPPSSARRRHGSMKERLPSNAYGGVGMGSRPSADGFEEGLSSALSTSSPHRYESPLARMYQASEGLQKGPGGARIRRLSMGAHMPTRANSLPDRDGGSEKMLGELMKMVVQLQRAVERLEEKVEEKDGSGGVV